MHHDGLVDIALISLALLDEMSSEKCPEFEEKFS
jgi:hypothetical protein